MSKQLLPFTLLLFTLRFPGVTLSAATFSCSSRDTTVEVWINPLRADFAASEDSGAVGGRDLEENSSVFSPSLYKEAAPFKSVFGVASIIPG